MKIIKLCSAVLLSLVISLFSMEKSFGEIFDRPTIKQLCETSEYVVLGRPIKAIKYETAIIGYQIVTFDIELVYKGRPSALDIAIDDNNGETIKGNFMNIIIQFRSPMTGSIVPEYSSDKKYGSSRFRVGM